MTTELPRMTINELSIRYELEPEIRDIFVEGIFDKEVLSANLNNDLNSGFMVYEIDSVELPSELLIKYDLTDGNKQRVIALAKELSILSNKYSYRCLVDKDLDHWFIAIESNAHLIWTEFTSIELCFFSDDILRDILVTTCKAKISSWDSFINSLIATLRNLYILRLADREFGLSLEWLPIYKFLSRNNTYIDFNFEEYIDRLLKKNRKYDLKDDFNSSIEKWQGLVIGDHHYYIRGHDFVEILAWTVGKFNGIKALASSLAIERLFILLAARQQIDFLLYEIKKLQAFCGDPP